MDFFARQESARKHTKLLEVYFAAAVIGTIALTYLVVAIFMGFAGHGRHYSGDAMLPGDLWDPSLFSVVTCITLAVIIGGSFYKMAALASGGKAVAEMLGGELIPANTTDPDKRKLLNVVEEMAIASGTPVPEVYFLPGERGINAFAAGHTTGDMVVCATEGALKLLTRDELQGVIGHEFSHILNGDMKLNLRLMGLLFGLLCIAIFGKILLQTRGRKNPLPLLGLGLLVVGSIGVFFGKLIKSAVSRQREFLADASPVQFTRNPEGLASALKKVGGSGSHIDDANAENASHFFFANGMRESFLGMFSTHPPVEERIRALNPAWDGQFITLEFPPSADEERRGPAFVPGPTPRPVRAPQMGDLLGGRALGGAMKPLGVLGAAIVLQAGAPTSKHLAYAADWRAKLPPDLDAAARQPMTAVALIYALLLSRDDAMRATQLQQLQTTTAPGVLQECSQLFAAATNLESPARLPLASLAMTALRGLSPTQFLQFEKNIQTIIASDAKLELFEYALQKMVLRRLEPNFKPPKRMVVQYYVLKPLVPDTAVLLSALAYAGKNESVGNAAAFQQGAGVLGLADIALLKPEDCALPKVDAALDQINQASLQIKKSVLNACAAIVAADGVIEESEAELLRAIADSLDCPIPPYLSL